MKANNVIYDATFSVLVIWLILPSSAMKNDISLILAVVTHLIAIRLS